MYAIIIIIVIVLSVSLHIGKHLVNIFPMHMDCTKLFITKFKSLVSFSNLQRIILPTATLEI